MRQIFVDSRDRSSGTSTNFSMSLPQTLSLESGHQGRIDDLRLPNAIPTISEANNILELTIGSTSYSKELTKGQVNSGDDLATKIRQQLAATTGTWTVTYDASLMTLTLSCSYPFVLTGGSFGKQLLSRPYERPDGSTYKFLYVPLQGLDMAYLCCSNFSHADNVGPKHSSDVLCAIPITAPYGSVQHYSMSNDVWFNVPAVTTQHLSFQLRDRDWNIVNSVANISFTLTID
jgi:hypothetical protein